MAGTLLENHFGDAERTLRMFIVFDEQNGMK